MRSASAIRPLIDDRDVAAERLGLLEIVRGEDDGGPGGVEFAQELPHGAADLDIDPRP
jgi:hypothetical protein